ncbi:hypothetical protein KIPB_003894 [Kipferlia bialata]|uniref:Uncharacterized protein n=1 Tax=Kipferlia bialata TaxID=797122 RepID=A0A391NVG4_9EUKA|nr:hypothetical protein KIPB_003894 [Kipferlia bialata]|eukprot:g3894.t1
MNDGHKVDVVFAFKMLHPFAILSVSTGSAALFCCYYTWMAFGSSYGPTFVGASITIRQVPGYGNGIVALGPLKRGDCVLR